MAHTLEEFRNSVVGFDKLNHADLIRVFAFFLHEHRAVEAFSVADIRKCYETLHRAGPSNLSSFVNAMAERKPPEALKVRNGYKLEARAREVLRARYLSVRPQAILVENALLDLPALLSVFEERAYLEEAIVCYRSGAFRAAIVMTWNLAYDRLCNCVFRTQLSDFNEQLPKNFSKAKPIETRDDFAELKESQVLQVCRSAGITSVSFNKLLKDKLDTRNSVAHPSSLLVSQLMAEAYIENLMTNIVSHLP